MRWRMLVSKVIQVHRISQMTRSRCGNFSRVQSMCFHLNGDVEQVIETFAPEKFGKEKWLNEWKIFLVDSMFGVRILKNWLGFSLLPTVSPDVDSMPSDQDSIGGWIFLYGFG